MNVYIGIDNGVSGTIGIISDEVLFLETPTKSEQSYTKKKANITRIEVNELENILRKYKDNGDTVFILMERPMVNPQRFQASVSAIRALEATLIVIEKLKFGFAYIDSKEWQKVLLPKGSQKEDLKKDSIDIGCRLFPMHSDLIKKHKDADGLLIAEYCRRFYGR